jgi:hypothetical protein
MNFLFLFYIRCSIFGVFVISGLRSDVSREGCRKAEDCRKVKNYKKTENCRKTEGYRKAENCRKAEDDITSVYNEGIFG